MPEVINKLIPDKRLPYVLIFALIISIIEASGQFFIKKSSELNKINYVFVGILFYSILCFVLYRSYFFENVGHMNLVWSCFSIILAFCIGYYKFDEPFNHYTVLAIIFACIAIIMSHYADELG